MSPSPNMDIFNAPSREVSCVRRDRTNTPLQALVTMNDPQFIEAARNLAQKAIACGFKSAFLCEHYGGDGLSVCAMNRDYLRSILPR